MAGSQSIRRQATVPAHLAGSRLDKAASELFEEFSRATLSAWITAGSLTVNGITLKPRTLLKGGEILNLDTVLELREDWASGQKIAFDVVYEDESLLVVVKPAGLVVHPGAGNPDQTLVNGLIERRPELNVLPRAGIVHRLDKDTSGLLVVAANLTALHQLTRAIQAREISRHYLAVIEGQMIAGQQIDRPIGRDPRQRTRQQVREDGKTARTLVRVQERFRRHTLIRAELSTGRTHQIRVHLASVGHPLVGDKRYGARGVVPPAPTSSTIDVIRGFGRQALHACELGLIHPQTGRSLSFEAPLPQDMEILLDALRQDVSASIEK